MPPAGVLCLHQSRATRIGGQPGVLSLTSLIKSKRFKNLSFHFATDLCHNVMFIILTKTVGILAGVHQRGIVGNASSRLALDTFLARVSIAEMKCQNQRQVGRKGLIWLLSCHSLSLKKSGQKLEQREPRGGS